MDLWVFEMRGCSVFKKYTHTVYDPSGSSHSAPCPKLHPHWPPIYLDLRRQLTIAHREEIFYQT